MNTTIEKPTIILCNNDLEAGFIVTLSKARAIEPIVFDLDWGELPELFDLKLNPKNMSDHVVLIEMPYPALENRLRACGKFVTIIDHHTITADDGQPIDRSRPRCSAFQLIAHLKWQLNTEEGQRLVEVEANDVGSWFALMRAFSHLPILEAEEKAHAVRKEESRIRARIAKRNDTPGDHEWSYWNAIGNISLQDEDAPCRGKYNVRILEPGLNKPSHRELHIVYGPSAQIENAGEAYFRELALAATKNAAKSADESETGILSARRSIEPPEILRLGLDWDADEHPIVKSLFFSGGSGILDLISDIVEKADESHDPEQQLVTGGNADSAYLYSFGEAEKLGTLANQIIDNAVHGAKPVSRWQTSFFMALQVPEYLIDWTSDHLKRKSTDKTNFGLWKLPVNTRNYFLPAIQLMVAPTIKQAEDSLKQSDPSGCKVSPLASWSIPVHGHFSLTVRNVLENNPKYYSFEIEEGVKELFVHRGFGNLVYLEWRFNNDDRLDVLEPWSKKSLWKLLCNPNVTLNLPKRADTVAKVLDFNYAARMCFSAGKRNPDDQRCIILREFAGTTKEAQTYFGDGDRENSYTPDGWFGMLVEHALKSMVTPGKDIDLSDIEIMMDERARFVSSLVPFGKAASLAAGMQRSEVIRARLAGGDDFSDHHFYNDKFALEELEKGTYRRFAPSKLYQATSHSFSGLFYGSFSGVLVTHMRDHYARMFLVTQSVVSTFQSLWKELVSNSTKQQNNIVNAEIQAEQTRRKMVNFSNGFWFHTLSHQIQGEELYAKMQEQLPVEREQKELNEEIANTEMLATNQRIKRDEMSRDFLAIIIGIFALFMAFLEVAREYWWSDDGTQLAVPFYIIFWLFVGSFLISWLLVKWRVWWAWVKGSG